MRVSSAARRTHGVLSLKEEAGHEKAVPFRHSFPRTLTADAQGPLRGGGLMDCTEEVLHRCWELKLGSCAC